ncbi:MAG: protein-L-isoaspartate O-methyltransferase [Pseudomonadota bacterium]|nr:protein-L-isoaspartate O-methyltransferase [Pseudomonadota bacterium]
MSADFAAERTNMVESQVRTADVTSLAIQDAMRAVRREELAPEGKGWLAYADTEIEYSPGRWMLRPRDVAKLLQGLLPRSGESALAIAAPYAAAVLSAMGLEVAAMEAGGSAPAPEAYDLVVCEGAVSKAPDAWLAALRDGGRLAVVERNGPVGRAMLYLRAGASVGSRPLFDSTPPVLAGFEAPRAFVL